MRAALLFVACCASAGCASGGTPPPEVIVPAITGVVIPAPVLEGTPIEVEGTDLDLLGRSPLLEVSAGSATFSLLALPHDEDGSRLFAMSADGVALLGAGTHTVSLVLRGSGEPSAPWTASMTIATELPIALEAAPSGDVHRNDVAILRGAGFLAGTEGTVTAHVVGMFAPDRGPAVAVDARLPVAITSVDVRDRGVLVLGTELSGSFPGQLTGTIALESELVSGARSSTAPIDVSLRFLPPELYGFDPAVIPLGRIVAIRGAGFLGGSDHPTETTLVRLLGDFTPEGGGAVVPIDVELVPRFVSGAELRMTVETEVRGEQVISRLFGAARGRFEGLAQPIAIAGRDEVEGEPVEFAIDLVGQRQVIHVMFLPAYYDTLARFGLAAAEREVEDRIIARIESIYAGYAIELRLTPPDDFDPSAYAVVEIGGPDPNGNGLFGYDNSPGKDVGNLRLFDHIGGANAETQADGYPGFGGVFVQSMLWWSEDPGLPEERPPSAPDPEPLFDEIFDPVRSRPATRAEARGEGEPARVAQVQRAIDALASIVGETTSHELGHSLGLAQPYGERTAFHNELDEEGCLMDSGADRPLGERASQPGFAQTHFCYDEPAYLMSILGG